MTSTAGEAAEVVVLAVDGGPSLPSPAVSATIFKKLNDGWNAEGAAAGVSGIGGL
jgi:hypothetical protein